MRREHNLLLPALCGVAAAETAQIPNRLPVQSSVTNYTILLAQLIPRFPLLMLLECQGHSSGAQAKLVAFPAQPPGIGCLV
jgi:hypothetical protein